MKLSDWARQQGLAVEAAAEFLRHLHDGELAGRKIVVVDEGETKNDLVQDMVDVLTSLCARLYGQRSAKNRAKMAMEAIRQ